MRHDTPRPNPCRRRFSVKRLAVNEAPAQVKDAGDRQGEGRRAGRTAARHGPCSGATMTTGALIGPGIPANFRARHATRTAPADSSITCALRVPDRVNPNCHQVGAVTSGQGWVVPSNR